MNNIFPDIITKLPQANIPFKGIKGWILQGEGQQMVFMEIEAIGKVDEHTHGAQWGMVVEGEMKLTIAGHARTYRKGDSYSIPAGTPHSAEFITKTWVVDYFDEKNRYNIK